MGQIPLEQIVIRRATLRDRPQLVQLQHHSLQTLCSQDYTPEQINAILRDKANYRRWKWGNDIFVAEYQDILLGFAGRMMCSISAVYVHPDWARQGIGTRLLQTVEADAVSRRVRNLFVRASVTAQPFYEACGYQVLASAQMPVQGVWLPCIDMQKQLIENATTPRSQPSLDTYWEAVQYLLIALIVVISLIKIAQWILP